MALDPQTITDRRGKLMSLQSTSISVSWKKQPNAPRVIRAGNDRKLLPKATGPGTRFGRS